MRNHQVAKHLDQKKYDPISALPISYVPVCENPSCTRHQILLLLWSVCLVLHNLQGYLQKAGVASGATLFSVSQIHQINAMSNQLRFFTGIFYQMGNSFGLLPLNWFFTFLLSVGLFGLLPLNWFGLLYISIICGFIWITAFELVFYISIICGFIWILT